MNYVVVDSSSAAVIYGACLELGVPSGNYRVQVLFECMCDMIKTHNL